jgi:hypothetical protein
LLYVPVNLLAQNEATLGRWDRLYYNSAVVAWRRNSTFFSWDQVFTDQGLQWTRNKAWQDIYGIHAALLPVSGETGALRHGWVILWGYNDARGPSDGAQYLVSAPEAEPYYFGALTGHWVSRLATSSVLLWHPSAGTDQAARYGYVRYLFDTHPWDQPGDYPPYNLFCSGHALLPDGRLLIVGGHSGLYRRSGQTGGFTDVGYTGLRLLAIFQAQNFRRDVREFQQNLWWRYYPPAPRNTDDPPEPRWYPSLVALPDGKVLIVGGTWYGADFEDFTMVRRSDYHELFDPCTNSILRSPSRRRVHPDLGGLYPRLHLVSFVKDGQLKARVVCTGPERTTWYLDPPFTSDLEWRRYNPQRVVSRGSGTSVLLPSRSENPQSWKDQVLDRVLTIGGTGDRRSETLSYDLHNFADGRLSIQHGVLPNHPLRVHLNAVLLPNGKVLIVGGRKYDRDEWYHPDDVVLQTLLYTPPADDGSLGSWEPVAPAPDEASPPAPDDESLGVRVVDGARVYHSTALLLPDGRVLAAGSATSAWRRGRDSSYVQRPFENYVPTIYSPPYLFKPDGSPRGETDRPRIVSINPDPTELNYGQVFKVTYALSSDGAAIRSVALVRPSSVTHSFNFEQRLVRLHFVVASSNVLHITAPWDPAIAPPGWYMLFLVDENGVPSVVRWVRLKWVCFAQPATLTVVLDGVQGASEEQAEAIAHTPLALELRHAGTGAPLMTYTLPMGRPDEQGRVALRLWSDLPAGQYELYVHPYRSWLGRRVRLDWQPGGSYTLLLRNGDVVKDNAVDIVDFVAVLEQLGTLGVSEADVNCDGVVDEADVELVATNTGTQGDE